MEIEIDPFLNPLVDNASPKLNPDLARGLAVKHIPEAEAYVDSVFRAVARGFPPIIQYIKGERCTPQQTFDEITKRKSNKRTFDVATSNLYMMRYIFRVGDEEVVRHISLPYVGDAGVIFLGGSRFVISPILADRVISILSTNMFVRLIRAKVTFERMSSHYMADGRRETAQVAWSLIYNKNPKLLKTKPIIRANTTLVHYLFCKYGFTETFAQFGCRPVIGNQTTITKEFYPEKDWIICSSVQIKPKTYTPKAYIPTQVRVAILRSEYNQAVKNLVCGFFYVVDHFPARIQPELKYVDNKRLWMVLMGHLLFSSSLGEGRLGDDVEEHIRSLDEYIDEVMRLKFKEIEMPITDIYQLFVIVIDKLNEWILGASDKVNSMYDKEFSILYYVLDEITKQINKFYFKLKSASNSIKLGTGTKRVLTKKEIETMMNQTIKTGMIFSITRNHGEVSTVSSSGDNMAFKITSILVPQASSSRQKGRNDNATIKDQSKRLHPSVAEVGSYTNLPKSEPSGQSRANLRSKLDSRGVVIKDPELAYILVPLDAKIKRS